MLEQVIVSSFEVRKSDPGDDVTYWRSAGASWLSLQIHMRNAAFFVAAAVWNEDLAGGEQFHDYWSAGFKPSTLSSSTCIPSATR